MSILLALLAAAPMAQPVDAPAAAAPAAVPTLVVFGELDKRMTVPVTIADAGPYRFIVDTGAERTVISRQLAQTLGLPAGRQVRVTAMTDTVSVGTVRIASLTVDAKAAPGSRQAHPFASPIGANAIEAPALEEEHLGAPGMLGIDTLQDHALVIDFDRGEMAVTPSVRRRARDAATDEIVVRAKSLFGQLIVTDASYAGTKVRVVIDTGSAVTMGNPALRRRVERQTKDLRPIALMSVTGNWLNADYTQVRRVTLGDMEMADLPVAFADALPFKRFGLADKPALLLGMDSLKLFRRVSIDFANREIRFLLPRTAFRPPTSGISIAPRR